MHDFISPATSHITSFYGSRTHPITGVKNKFHYGIDYSGLASHDVVSAADGIVRIAKSMAGYGNVIMITHTIRGKIYETVYAHLQTFNVKQGAKVKQGQLIGIMGNTGSSTSRHLHFELFNGHYRSNYSNTLNPLAYVFDPNTLELQQLLNKTAPFNLKEDGFRGENTINATAVFQKRQKLNVDGYAGNATFDTLRKLVKSPPKQVASDSPLLNIIANNESNTGTLITTSETLKKAYTEHLQRAIDSKIVQPKWLQDYLSGKLSISDAIHLDVLIRANS
ncbi:peptidoglycan DD-metalloendopeptidase family protein [Sporosarcina sp. FSL W7-1283]|uniref:peptidoglycan DD-metalloendopeptidase family protein n=1 Tax=Sporosarcina sp. FSL W7-1283 TaxID=2921560 RepID=UPI0030F8FA97